MFGGSDFFWWGGGRILEDLRFFCLGGGLIRGFTVKKLEFDKNDPKK